MIQGFRVKTREGRYRLEAHAQFIGSDLLLSIWGGDRPHIGAVAVAQPRPSLQDPNRTSSTASVICFPGHKEDEMAKEAALSLSAGLGINVVVVAGIHWDNLDEAGITEVLINSKALVAEVMNEARSSLRN